mmetsp:Transcript_18723/g.56351  ORF Transcript_18723/g.56351 Transcript_18723/m.56351 type:complete len:269 (+) Transcript_18723:207-1013(+)
MPCLARAGVAHCEGVLLGGGANFSLLSRARHSEAASARSDSTSSSHRRRASATLRRSSAVEILSGSRSAKPTSPASCVGRSAACTATSSSYAKSNCMTSTPSDRWSRESTAPLAQSSAISTRRTDSEDIVSAKNSAANARMSSSLTPSRMSRCTAMASVRASPARAASAATPQRAGLLPEPAPCKVSKTASGIGPRTASAAMVRRASHRSPSTTESGARSSAADVSRGANARSALAVDRRSLVQEDASTKPSTDACHGPALAAAAAMA